MISIKAFAKINLGLRILRKRDDGYHDIETVFVRVNPFDEIFLEDSSEINFRSGDKSLPSDDNNLCVRAAKLLQERKWIKKGASILLNKNIPIGAGLGGGSSDAAAMLLGLTKLWDIDTSEEELKAFALELGSDVPYFLKGGSAYATGRGEILEYFPLNIPYWILLLYPDIHVSTGWAYGTLHTQEKIHYDRSLIQPDPAVRPKEFSLKTFVLNNITNPHELNQKLTNDFEPVVLHRHKQIGYAKLMLYSEGASFAQMSGSGSSVYGFFTDGEKAASAHRNLKNKHRVFLTPPGFQPE